MEILIAIVTLILSFFFSGMEIALYSSSRLKIEMRAAQGGWAGKVLSRYTRQDASHAIITILIGNNFALVIFTLMLETILNPVLESRGLSQQGSFILYTLVQSLIGTLIVLVLAEYIPKAIFRANSDRVIFPAAYVLRFFHIILYFPVFLVDQFRHVLLRILFGKASLEQSNEIELGQQELEHYLQDVMNTSEKEEIPHMETEMLQNALEFRETKARECMIPRTEIEAVNEAASLDELMDKFIDTQLSRLVIYGESLDEIKGFVHSSSMFSKPEGWQSLIQPVIPVPETMSARDLLAELTENKKSVALVVDEFGGTAGILTLEDLVEEVFGEIEDEYYEEEVEEDLKKIRQEDGSLILGARLEIDQLNEEFELELPEEEYYTTLGGLVMYISEEIPQADAEIEIGSYHLTILDATPTRVISVRLEGKKGN